MLAPKGLVSFMHIVNNQNGFMLDTSFLELMSDVSIHDGSDDDEPVRRACKLKDMELPPQLQKLKLRMLVLRMKMLHTIRSFHFYLMTRVSLADGTPS